MHILFQMYTCFLLGEFSQKFLYDCSETFCEWSPTSGYQKHEIRKWGQFTGFWDITVCADYPPKMLTLNSAISLPEIKRQRHCLKNNEKYIYDKKWMYFIGRMSSVYINVILFHLC